jgi:probable rRNA maturation factor
MAIKINCEDKNPSKAVSIPAVKRAAKKALVFLRKRDAELNIMFVSNRKMRAMNKRYLGRDSATDVLAFCPGRDGSIDKRFLGDIMISSDMAENNRKVFGTGFDEEIALYVIHGILHLAGYEDKTKEERRVMKRIEDGLVKKSRRLR